MKIAIIGAGAMGGATLQGLMLNNVRPGDICLCARTCTRLNRWARVYPGISVTTDCNAAISNASIVILASGQRPCQLRQLDISAAPGQIFFSYAPDLGPDNDDFDGQAVQVMPSIALSCAASMTWVVKRQHTKLEAVDAALEFFGKLGTALVLPPELLPAATALTGCGIAYILRYVRAASQGGVQAGMPPRMAVDALAATLQSAAAMLEAEPDVNPEELIDRVTTPGGLTIRGLNAMEQAGFSAAVVAGILASK